MELNSKNIKKILFIIFIGAIIFFTVQNPAVIWGFLGKAVSVFSPIIAALCIAFVFNVLLTPLENKVFVFFDKSKHKFVKKMKRPVSLVATYLIAFGILSTVVLVIIPDVIDTLIYLAEKLPSFVLSIRDWAENTLERFNITQTELPDIKIDWSAIANSIIDWLKGAYPTIFGDAVNITTSVFAGLFDTIFSIVISVYILAGKERIGAFTKRTIDAFLPRKVTDIIYHISSRTYELFSRFIGGQLVEALILGTLCFVGMSLFRMPNALIISVLISITALVPIIGATVGVIIGFLLIVITSPLKAVLFVAFLLILQQLEGNLIYPKVVGKAVGLPGVIVVSAVLIGGNIGGVFGTLIAVPTSAVLYTLLREAVEKRR